MPVSEHVVVIDGCCCYDLIYIQFRFFPPSLQNEKLRLQMSSRRRTTMNLPPARLKRLLAAATARLGFHFLINMSFSAFFLPSFYLFPFSFSLSSLSLSLSLSFSLSLSLRAAQELSRIKNFNLQLTGAHFIQCALKKRVVETISHALILPHPNQTEQGCSHLRFLDTSFVSIQSGCWRHTSMI